MIEKKELLELAKLNALKPWQQEKHYVQAILLGVLSEQPLVFKGGTYLWFFHGLPRFSENLDFTATAPLPKNLPGTVSKALELFGIQNQLKTITDDPNTLSFRVSAKGPLNTAAVDECRVYVEISRREAVVEKPLPLKLDFPAYNLPIKRVAGMSLGEVAAEKVRALLTREKARDLYDLHHLIEKKRVAFNRELVDNKLAYYGKKFSGKDFLDHARRKRAYFAKELRNLVFDDLPEFSGLLRTLENWAKPAKGPRP